MITINSFNQMKSNRLTKVTIRINSFNKIKSNQFSKVTINTVTGKIWRRTDVVKFSRESRRKLTGSVRPHIFVAFTSFFRQSRINSFNKIKSNQFTKVRMIPINSLRNRKTRRNQLTKVIIITIN
jgi:hypothetical protein